MPVIFELIGIRDAKYIYLIDYENTRAGILDEMEGTAPEGSLFLVFYSEQTRTPEKILDSLSWDPDVRFIDCKAGVHDAMDFQITAMAGRLSSLYPRTRYVIVSGDTGYDPAVRMLQEYGIHITRMAAPALPVTAREGTHAATQESVQEMGNWKKKPVREEEWRRMVEKACKVARINKVEAGYLYVNTWGVRDFNELNHALQLSYPRDQKTKKIPRLFKAMRKMIEADQMFERMLQ